MPLPADTPSSTSPPPTPSSSSPLPKVMARSQLAMEATAEDAEAEGGGPEMMKLIGGSAARWIDIMRWSAVRSRKEREELGMLLPHSTTSVKSRRWNKGSPSREWERRMAVKPKRGRVTMDRHIEGHFKESWTRERTNERGDFGRYIAMRPTRRWQHVAPRSVTKRRTVSN